VAPAQSKAADWSNATMRFCVDLRFTVLMDWDMQESAFEFDWLNLNSTNNVDLTPIK
jgi:hypothetical protein